MSVLELVPPDEDLTPVCAWRMPGGMANSLGYLLNTLCDEAKVRWDGSEMTLCSRMVDPANVGMMDLQVDLSTELGTTACLVRGEGEMGVHLDWLRKRLLWSRIPEHYGDEVEVMLSQPERKYRTRVERDVIRTSTIGSIDPDSVRQEPDLPDLDLPNQVVVEDPDQIYQAVQAVDDASDHLRVSARENSNGGYDLEMYGQGDVEDETVLIPEVGGPGDVPDPGASSLFSLDYLKDMAQALKYAKMERIAISWGVEYPTKLHFSQSEWGISGTMMLAPRIKSD